MRAIDGKTRTCGLIGNPVEHTLSPVLHNTLADMLGQNLAYLPFPVEQGNLEQAIAGAWALNLLGLNVTVPYKSEVLPFLKEIDSLAEQIGAVNTLVRVEGGYKGYNTDMPGLYRAMCEDGIGLEGEKVLILGAGGVARAVALLCAEKGAGEIIILNRTLEKAQAIAEEVNALTENKKVQAWRLEEYKRLPADAEYLAIQTTSVGMHPHVDAAVIEDAAFYRRIHTGYDLIFNPWETKFMKLVQEQGGKAYNGLKMLLYQGVIAYELWTGISVKQEDAQYVYGKMQEGVLSHR